ncbi:MAG: AraC family transcriptional regulator [Planctomycetota bacterium]
MPSRQAKTLWVTAFLVVDRLPALPTPTLAGWARSDHPDIRFRIEDRTDDVCIFLYTLSGYGMYRDASGTQPVPAGSGFLKEIRDEETGWFFPSEATQPWEYMWIAFDGGNAHELVRQILERYGALYTLPSSSPVLSLMKNWRQQRSQTLRLTAWSGAQIVMDLLHALADSRHDSRPRTEHRMLAEAARELIYGRLLEAPTVTDIAEALGVSREHLARVFKAELKMNPKQFLRLCQMQYACRLLKETSLPTKEVGRRLGYDRVSNFTHAFKQSIGMPPGQFRREGTTPPSLAYLQVDPVEDVEPPRA